MSNIVFPATTLQVVAWDGSILTYSIAPFTVPLPQNTLALPPAPRYAETDDVEEVAWRSVRELLTPQEKRLLSRYQYLPIRSRLHPGFTYRIHMDSDTPHVYYRGEYVGYLCVGFADDDMPDADTLLMHKLWIEGDEAGYLREANSWRDGGTSDACAWLERG